MTATGVGARCPADREPIMTAFDAYLGQMAAHGRVDLWFEMRMAVRNTRNFGGLPALAEVLGVTRAAIQNAGGIGVFRVDTTGRYFGPAASGGDLVAIVPVFEIGPDGEAALVDLVAFRTNDPSRTWIRTGLARALGLWYADAIRAATPIWRLPSDPPPPVLKLYATPLSWLHAACNGACILNTVWVDYVLSGVEAVVAENALHARHLHEALPKRGLPKILLREERAAA